MITVEHHVGALIEMRFTGSPTLADAARFKEETAALVTRVAAATSRRAVLVTDLRDTAFFAHDVADEIIQLMRRDNPRVERNGVLGQGDTFLTLQTERMLLEAASPGRRKMFTRMSDLLAWLDEALVADERARLRAFLGR